MEKWLVVDIREPYGVICDTNDLNQAWGVCESNWYGTWTVVKNPEFVKINNHN